MADCHEPFFNYCIVRNCPLLSGIVPQYALIFERILLENNT